MLNRHRTALLIGPWLLSVVMVLIQVVSAAGMEGSPAQSDSAGGRGEKGRLPQIRISLAGRTIVADVANDDRTRRQGLLGWQSITDERGMLLDFGLEREYAIHMQGMKFPIDALWIDAAGNIKLIYHDIQPNSGLVYPSLLPCTYCLEIKAGFCKRFGVKMGRRIRFGTADQ